jgi:hypothetical protein
MHASPVSLTPANACFAGVNDIGEEFFAGGEELFTGVNDTGNACIVGVVDTGDAPK